MRNCKKFLFIILLSFFAINCSGKRQSTTENNAEIENWVNLFNGVDLDNWEVKIKGHPLGENWNQTFIVVDSAIRVDYSNYKTFDSSFGHLFYKVPFNNYKFKISYRFLGEQLEGGENWALRNSGVMIHCQSPGSMKLDQDFPVCIEVQLLGGISEKKSRSTANLCTPGTHVTINDQLVTDHCKVSNSDTFYGEQWVNLEIEVRNDSLIRHYINGKKVMEYRLPVIGGEYNTIEKTDGTPVNKGFIALQSESHPVEFKNIMLLDLNQ
ncbi:MAG: DUF1080 domain-containing protein [Flavobacteriales bacterium]|nr:DUF1080 domain-containing protein [Flavobacteriales bacterium]